MSVETPLVSICMITYNHANYISSAIEGILMQITRFSIQLVIGEDSSSDDTRKICEEYASKFPQKIRLLPSNERYGMAKNFMRVYDACKGKYIALCDGDDYWIDPQKLQKQVDFLETNNEYAICFTDARILDQQKNLFSSFSLTKKLSKTSFTQKDIIKKNFIPTLTAVFRHNLIVKFPVGFETIYPVDWPLYILVSEFGLIKFMPFESAVYRKHQTGICSSSKPSENFRKYLCSIETMMKWYDNKSPLQQHFKKSRRKIKIEYWKYRILINHLKISNIY